MATYSRNKEVAAFCLSLKNQTYHDFELIIVDQNQSDMLTPVVREYSQYFIISHIKSEKTGLSYNRNIGLAHARGDIIAFPDDDCEYRPDTLEFVNKFFITNNCDLFTFNYEDKTTAKKAFKQCKRLINIFNIYQQGISFCIFIKQDIIIDFHFDERLGVGAEFGAGEETDMIIYLLKRHALCLFDGNYTIYHHLSPTYNLKRAYNYGLGFGALFKKTISHYHLYFLVIQFFYYVVRNIGALCISCHKRYYYMALKGKLYGFYKY